MKKLILIPVFMFLVFSAKGQFLEIITTNGASISSGKEWVILDDASITSVSLPSSPVAEQTLSITNLSGNAVTLSSNVAVSASYFGNILPKDNSEMNPASPILPSSNIRIIYSGTEWVLIN